MYVTPQSFKLSPQRANAFVAAASHTAGFAKVSLLTKLLNCFLEAYRPTSPFTFANAEKRSDINALKTNRWAQTGRSCTWICDRKSHVRCNCFSKSLWRLKAVTFSRATLRLWSYHPPTTTTPARQNTQIRSRWALSMSSGRCRGIMTQKMPILRLQSHRRTHD